MSGSCKYCNIFNGNQSNFSFELCTEAIMQILTNLTSHHKSGKNLENDYKPNNLVILTRKVAVNCIFFISV